MSDSASNEQPSNTECADSSKELEKMLHASKPGANRDKVIEAEEAKVIEVKSVEKKSGININLNGFKALVILWLALITGFLGYVQLQLNAQVEASLTEHEIVFYPFGKANKQLKAQGYDFNAIRQYNNNMIRILNSEGKVVLPAATAHGEVPDSLVVELMSVAAMNALAAKQAE